MVFPIVTKFYKMTKDFFFLRFLTQSSENVFSRLLIGWRCSDKLNPTCSEKFALYQELPVLLSYNHVKNQNHSWLWWLESKRRNLDVSVDVETIVFAGQHHAPIIHQRDIKTLSMLHLESNTLFINASKYFMLRLPDWAPREKEKYLRLVFGIKLKIFSSTDWLLQPFWLQQQP